MAPQKLQSLLLVIQLQLDAELARFNSGNGPDLALRQICCIRQDHIAIYNLGEIRSFRKGNSSQFLDYPVLGNLGPFLPLLHALRDVGGNLNIS